jgi:hypothetical protein
LVIYPYIKREWNDITSNAYIKDIILNIAKDNAFELFLPTTDIVEITGGGLTEKLNTIESCGVVRSYEGYQVKHIFNGSDEVITFDLHKDPLEQNKLNDDDYMSSCVIYKCDMKIKYPHLFGGDPTYEKGEEDEEIIEQLKGLGYL